MEDVVQVVAVVAVEDVVVGSVVDVEEVYASEVGVVVAGLPPGAVVAGVGVAHLCILACMSDRCN